MVCGRHGMWPSWFVAVMVCGRHGLWPSWSVAVIVELRHFGCRVYPDMDINPRFTYLLTFRSFMVLDNGCLSDTLLVLLLLVGDRETWSVGVV